MKSRSPSRSLSPPTRLPHSMVWWTMTAGIARTADEMAGPALLITVLTTTGDPHAAGACVAAMTLATGIAGPLVGARLDASTSPRRLTAASMACMAVAMMAIGLITGRSTALVALLAILAGLAAPVVSGGWTAQLPGVVPRGALATATAWDAATYNVAGIVGPGAVGLLGLIIAERSAITIAGAVMLLAVPLALSVPTHAERVAGQEGRRPRDTKEEPALWAEVTTGLSLLWSNRALRRVTLITTVGYLGFGAAFVGIPTRAQELGVPASSGGILLGCFAVGALIGTFVTGYTRIGHDPDRAVVLGTMALGAGLVLSAWMPNVTAVGLVLVPAGLAEGILFTGLLRVRHREAPDRYRGQIFTTAASLKIGAYALGMGAIILLTTDGRTLLVLAGAVQGLAVACGLAASARGGRDGTSPELLR